jgi:hypothetical protein
MYLDGLLDGWKVARYDPYGLMTEIEIAVEADKLPSAGGYEQLYVTSASVGLDKAEQPLARRPFQDQDRCERLAGTVGQAERGCSAYGMNYPG